jgi:hypothetical protein
MMIPGRSGLATGSDRGAAERDAGFQRTGRLAKVAGRTGDAGHATRPSELAPIGSGLLAWPFVTHTPPKPHIALRRAPPYVDIYGDVVDRTSTSTEENGSGWPAQRLGGRRVVCRLVETAERAPIASTVVTSRSPVT